MQQICGESVKILYISLQRLLNLKYFQDSRIEKVGFFLFM